MDTKGRVNMSDLGDKLVFWLCIIVAAAYISGYLN